MASRWWLLRGPAASRTNWSCVDKRTRGVVSETWVSVLRGGRHTATPSTACCIGRSWSAWPIQHRPTSELSIESLVQKEVSAQLRKRRQEPHTASEQSRQRPARFVHSWLLHNNLLSLVSAASSSAADMNLESKGKGGRERTKGTV